MCVCARVFRSLCAWCVCITTYVVGSLVSSKCGNDASLQRTQELKSEGLRSNSIGPKNINQRTTRHNNRFSLTRDQQSYLGRGVFQKKTHLLRRHRFVHRGLNQYSKVVETKISVRRKFATINMLTRETQVSGILSSPRSFSQLTNILLGKG